MVAEFEAVLEREGVHGALRHLNARTRHRYTGIYRFDPPMLRNLCLYDRENPSLRVGGDSPMQETYCSLVGADDAPFSVEDAALVERLVDHPARDRFIAYCGTPVRDATGRCIGTLCHFDVRPRLVPVDDIPLLERAARSLAPWVNGERSVHAPRRHPPPEQETSLTA